MRKLALLFALSFLFSPSLWAACASPTAAAGSLNWNTGTSQFQYCDGTTWQNFGGGIPGGSTGYVQFNNSSAFGGDSALFWDNTNKRLGIGTATPGAPLHIYGTSAPLVILDRASGTSNTYLKLAQAGTATGYIGIAGTTDGMIAGSASGDIAIQSVNQKILFSTDGGTSAAMTLTGGNVGIGTASPDSRLMINGNTAATPATPPSGTYLHLLGSDAGTTRLTMDDYGPTGAGASNNFTMRQAGGTAASPTASTASATLGTIAFMGYGATGFSTARAWILGAAAESWTDTAQGTYLGFSTTATGTAIAPTERMRIDAAGNVGIGTASPQVAMHVLSTIPTSTGNGQPYRGGVTVEGDNATFGGRVIVRQAAGTGTFSLFRNNGTIASPTAIASADNLGALVFGGYDGSIINTTATVSGIAEENFTTSAHGTAVTIGTTSIGGAFGSTERMRISANGNVGIGTTTPGAKLDVYAPSTTTAANVLGIQMSGAQSTANTGNYYGMNLVPTYSAASGNTLAGLIGAQINAVNTNSGTVSGLYGIVNIPQNTSSGTVGNLWGGYIIPQNTGSGPVTTLLGEYVTPQNAGSGTVTNHYGVLSVPQKTGTGAVSTMYSLYGGCDNLNATGAVTTCYELFLATPTTTGAITNKWGVYQADSGTPNYFAGKVGIGTATVNHKLDVNGNIGLAASQYINFGSTDGTGGYGLRDNGGYIECKSSGGTWQDPSLGCGTGGGQGSDKRLKENIHDLSGNAGLEAVMKLRPVAFRWKDKTKDQNEGAQIGFIAQELEKVFPNLVQTADRPMAIETANGKETIENPKSIKYQSLVAPLVKAVQELKADNDNLRAANDNLERRIEKLEAQAAHH